MKPHTSPDRRYAPADCTRRRSRTHGTAHVTSRPWPADCTWRQCHAEHGTARVARRACPLTARGGEAVLSRGTTRVARREHPLTARGGNAVATATVPASNFLFSRGAAPPCIDKGIEDPPFPLTPNQATSNSKLNKKSLPNVPIRYHPIKLR